MTDKINETIPVMMSAMMDGEASEIEVHQVLRHYRENPSMRERWISFQQIRNACQNEQHVHSEIHLALHERISAAIEAEPEFSNVTPIEAAKGSSIGVSGAKHAWMKPAAGGFAVAASLVVAVFMTLTPAQQAADVASAPASLAAGLPTTSISQPVINAQPVSTGTQFMGGNLPVQNLAAGAEFEGDSDHLELRELDEEKQRLLRQYLNEHDRAARLNPYSRMVSNPAATKQN